MILQSTVQGGEGKADRKSDGKTTYHNGNGLGVGEAFRKADDTEEWRKVVARSFLMSHRSFRLRHE